MHGSNSQMTFEFASDLLALDMGPIDAILGCDWSQPLGKIKMDFKALSLSFVHKDRWIILHGVAASKLQVISAR